MNDREAALMELYEGATAVRDRYDIDAKSITILVLTVACQLWAEAEQGNEDPTPFEAIAGSVFERWANSANVFEEP